MALETSVFKDVLANSTESEKKARINGSIQGLKELTIVKEELAARTLKWVKFGIENNTEGKEAGFYRNYFTASEFSHPIFQTAWG